VIMQRSHLFHEIEVQERSESRRAMQGMFASGFVTTLWPDWELSTSTLGVAPTETGPAVNDGRRDSDPRQCFIGSANVRGGVGGGRVLARFRQCGHRTCAANVRQSADLAARGRSQDFLAAFGVLSDSNLPSDFLMAELSPSNTMWRGEDS
jgi:hypothetical protein